MNSEMEIENHSIEYGENLRRLMASEAYWPPIPIPQFHYTTLEAMEGILRSGQIELSVWDTEERDDVCMLVWTSAAPIWEPACSATRVLSEWPASATGQLVDGKEFPVARVQIDPNCLYEWSRLCCVTDMHWGDIAWISQVDLRNGSDPHNWAASPFPIPSKAWISIEVWSGDYWIPIAQSENPACRELARQLPDHIAHADHPDRAFDADIIDGLRAKGGSWWFNFLKAAEYHAIVTDLRGGSLTHEQLLDVLWHAGHFSQCYELTAAIAYLPTIDLQEVAARCGRDAIFELEWNVPYALSVAAYWGVPLETLYGGMKTLTEEAIRAMNIQESADASDRAIGFGNSDVYLPDESGNQPST